MALDEDVPTVMERSWVFKVATLAVAAVFGIISTGSDRIARYVFRVSARDMGI